MSIDTINPHYVEALLAMTRCIHNVAALYNKEGAAHDNCNRLVQMLYPYVKNSPFRQDDKYVADEKKQRKISKKYFKNNAKKKIKQLLTACECEFVDDVWRFVDNIDNEKLLKVQPRVQVTGTCDFCLSLKEHSIAIKKCKDCSIKLCGFHSITHVCSPSDIDALASILAVCNTQTLSSV